MSSRIGSDPFLIACTITVHSRLHTHNTYNDVVLQVSNPARSRTEDNSSQDEAVSPFSPTTGGGYCSHSLKTRKSEAACYSHTYCTYPSVYCEARRTIGRTCTCTYKVCIP